MKFATKEMILKTEDLKTEDIEVKEWDLVIRIKALSLTQYSVLKNEKLTEEQYFYKILAMSIIDEQGNRLFSDEEYSVLGDKSPDTLKFIFSHIEVLNGFKKSNKERKEEFESDPLKDLPTV